jgi:hypothetical protein
LDIPEGREALERTAVCGGQDDPEVANRLLNLVVG